jgi:hypothetical protein
MFGCAAIAALIGGIGMLFWPGVTFGEWIIGLLMLASITFVAVIILKIRDGNQYESHIRVIRTALLARKDITDDEFRIPYQAEDAPWALQVREAIAKFYQVPASKIHPDDDLAADLGFYMFDIVITHYVFCHVLAANRLEDRRFSMSIENLHRLPDLTNEIRRFFDGNDADASGDSIRNETKE